MDGLINQTNEDPSILSGAASRHLSFVCGPLHLNLPAPNDGPWTIFWRRTRWLLLGIPAPELLTAFAFTQWSSAGRSRAEMRRIGNTDSKRIMVLAFYADMGGFVLYTPDT